MIETVPDILARIVAHKRQELAEVRITREQWEQSAAGNSYARRDFRAALLARPPAVIAEIKKASPSKGLIAARFDPPALAASYERGGAAALSVLTDTRFFQGSLADLQAARAAVRLPALRKDFTVEEYHVAEAAAHGADAILLIVAIHTAESLRRLREYAAGFGLAALVEVHDEAELAVAVNSGADIIGVNNRNLRTFEVSLDTSLRLAERMPSGVVLVSESGIESAAHIRLLRDAGYHAFLIGEHLMRAPDPAAALQALTA
jgi:indole-3-glycerol phosphate synthase